MTQIGNSHARCQVATKPAKERKTTTQLALASAVCEKTLAPDWQPPASIEADCAGRLRHSCMLICACEQTLHDCALTTNYLLSSFSNWCVFARVDPERGEGDLGPCTQHILMQKPWSQGKTPAKNAYVTETKHMEVQGEGGGINRKCEMPIIQP